MKLAAPIALVISGVALFVTLMWRLPSHVRTDADIQADQDKITAAEQQWMSQDPAMKAEDDQLALQRQQAERTKGKALDAESEARRNFEDHHKKIEAEVIKADPSLVAAYDRLAADRIYHGPDSGSEELAAQYDLVGRERELRGILNLSFVTIYPAVMIATGIFLLIRRTTIGGAHLYLLFGILPTVCAAPPGIAFRNRTIPLGPAPRWPNRIREATQE